MVLSTKLDTIFLVEFFLQGNFYKVNVFIKIKGIKLNKKGEIQWG